jgi:Arylsulfatase A and related enzymes
VSREFMTLYWEFHELGGRQTIRKGDWKAIRLNVGNKEKTTLELYNLKDDLHEDNNLADQYPEIVQELSSLMDKDRTESPLFNFGR